MRKFFLILSFVLLIGACGNEAKKLGNHFQEYRDLESLKKATEMIAVGSDTSYVKKILGTPVNFGFDFRYFSDSVGKNGYNIGAVFGINEQGKVSWKDILEICE